MIGLERRLGPMRLRAWGLAANFLANLVGLYGLSRVLAGSGGWFPLYAGALGTVICIAVLARPAGNAAGAARPASPPSADGGRHAGGRSARVSGEER